MIHNGLVNVFLQQESHAVTPFQATTPAQITYPNDEVGSLYDKLVSELELYLQNALATGVIAAGNPQIAAMHGLREALLIAKRARDPTSALSLLQKVFFLWIANDCDNFNQISNKSLI